MTSSDVAIDVAVTRKESCDRNAVTLKSGNLNT